LDNTPVSLKALACSNPPYKLGQDDIREICRTVFNDRADLFERLSRIYDNAGIDYRYSCVPLKWYGQTHDWQERMALYESHALDLLETATQNALQEACLTSRDIDVITYVSSTGIVTPTLDALLSDRMGMRSDVIRLPVFGLGCAGGVSGLAQAATQARAHPGKNILFLVVELCALTFRSQDMSKANLIASALFGDGAAAAVVRCDPSDTPALAHITLSGEHLWPDSKDIMGWNIEDDGLGVIFSRDIPNFIIKNLPDVLEAFLRKADLTQSELAGYLFHPGGAKVLQAYSESLNLTQADLELSRQSLRQFGNMSAVSALKVLQAGMINKQKGLHLMMALGPGFTASFLLIDLQ